VSTGEPAGAEMHRMNDKQARERDFHNAAFSDHRRAGAAGAYAILHDSRIFYEGFIRAHAPGARMLEFGCGAAAMGSLFGASAAEVVGIDISDVAVAEAARRAAASGLRATYHVMDAEALQFPAGSFDLICSAAILHHLDLRKAYAEIARTLTPDGHAIFMEPLAYNPAINLFRRLTPHLRTPDEHPLRIEDLDLAREYFDDVEVRYYALATLFALPFRRFKRNFMRILLGLERLDRGLFRVMPWIRKYAWHVVIVLSQPKRP
jgi:SAM-dependent methyltransferase